MNKRVATEIPEAMYRLFGRYAVAKRAMDEIRDGNSRTYTMEQLEREVELDN